MGFADVSEINAAEGRHQVVPQQPAVQFFCPRLKNLITDPSFRIFAERNAASVGVHPVPAPDLGFLHGPAAPLAPGCGPSGRPGAAILDEALRTASGRDNDS
jgi:hypothetical protein